MKPEVATPVSISSKVSNLSIKQQEPVVDAGGVGPRSEGILSAGKAHKRAEDISNTFSEQTGSRS